MPAREGKWGQQDGPVRRNGAGGEGLHGCRAGLGPKAPNEPAHTCAEPCGLCHGEPRRRTTTRLAAIASRRCPSRIVAPRILCPLGQAAAPPNAWLLSSTSVAQLGCTGAQWVPWNSSLPVVFCTAVARPCHTTKPPVPVLSERQSAHSHRQRCSHSGHGRPPLLACEPTRGAMERRLPQCRAQSRLCRLDQRQARKVSIAPSAS